MTNFKNQLVKRLAIVLLIALLGVTVGLILNNGGDEFVVPTAIGDTQKEFIESEDFKYLDRANRAFINLVKRTSPSVVQIRTITEHPAVRSTPRMQIIPPEGLDREEFRRFLERFRGDSDRWFFEESTPDEEAPPAQSVGIGSGVIVSDDGYILTNSHVIHRADEITVILHDGKEFEAKLIGQDPGGTEVSGTDLAVLKIDSEDLPTLPFGDSDSLEVGEWVIAIGTPFNLSQTVTRGVVSAKNRANYSIKYSNFIQTDTPINRGNSGGALINIRGELVGINTLIATDGISVGNVGIGFAIPSNTANELLPQLIEHGKIVRGWLGIRMESVSHDLAEKLKLDGPKGAFVVNVGPNSPAEKAGLRPGDVILELNEKEIKDSTHLMHLIASAGAGAKVELKVLRNGKEKQLSVKLEKRTEAAIASFETPDKPVTSQVSLSGMSVQNLTPEIARRYGHQDESGVVVVDIERGSLAARQGIQPGYLITEIDYTEIESVEDYETIVGKLKEEDEKFALVHFKDLRQRSFYKTLRIDVDDR